MQDVFPFFSRFFGVIRRIFGKTKKTSNEISVMCFEIHCNYMIYDR